MPPAPASRNQGDHLAAAQKLSSTGYGSQTRLFNLSGDLIVGGRTVKITATDTFRGFGPRSTT